MFFLSSPHCPSAGGQFTFLSSLAFRQCFTLSGSAGSTKKLQVMRATVHKCTGAASPVPEAGTTGDQGDWTVLERGMLDKVGIDFVCPVCELCLFSGTGIMAVDKHGHALQSAGLKSKAELEKLPCLTFTGQWGCKRRSSCLHNMFYVHNIFVCVCICIFVVFCLFF